MQHRDLNAIAGVLGRLMAELQGVPDENSNFPTFQPTSREDLQVKPWQADLQPGDHFIGYYPSIDLFLYGGVLVDKERRREPRQFQRYVHVYSDVAPGGEYGVFHVSSLVALITQQQFRLFERNSWHPESRDQVVESFYDLHDDSTPESMPRLSWKYPVRRAEPGLVINSACSKPESGLAVAVE